MKYKLIPLLILSIIASPACYSSAKYPPNNLVSESSLACIGMAQTYGSESRRFDHDAVISFMSSQVDDCVQALSWLRFDSEAGKEIISKINSDWNRTDVGSSDDESRFYVEFHNKIMSGASRAASDDNFLKEMVSLGQFYSSSKNHSNL